MKRSTTVEITIGYLTANSLATNLAIYNSRNYYRLLNSTISFKTFTIYNSRNYYRLLNKSITLDTLKSTTVEITIGYLTLSSLFQQFKSTTVEITIGYLTPFLCFYTIFCLVTIIFDYFFIYFTHIY